MCETNPIWANLPEGAGVAEGRNVQNKPNFRPGPGGARLGDEGCCTNKPNSCHYADPEIGVPRWQACKTKPIRRRPGGVQGTKCAKQTQLASRRTGRQGRVWSPSCKTNPIPRLRIADWGQPCGLSPWPGQMRKTNPISEGVPSVKLEAGGSGRQFPWPSRIPHCSNVPPFQPDPDRAKRSQFSPRAAAMDGESATICRPHPSPPESAAFVWWMAPRMIK